MNHSTLRRSRRQRPLAPIDTRRKRGDEKPSHISVKPWGEDPCTRCGEAPQMETLVVCSACAAETNKRPRDPRVVEIRERNRNLPVEQRVCVCCFKTKAHHTYDEWTPLVNDGVGTVTTMNGALQLLQRVAPGWKASWSEEKFDRAMFDLLSEAAYEKYVTWRVEQNV